MSGHKTRDLWASCDGVRIHGIEWSPPVEPQGVPFVVVPGLLANAALVEDDGIAAATGRFGSRPRRLLSVDRRGLGLSSAPERGYRIVDFARDVHALTECARMERYVLFGQSFGVPIVIEYALSWPERVAGLVLGAQWPGCDRLDASEPLLAWAAGRRPLGTLEDVYDELRDVTGLPRATLERTIHRYVHQTPLGLEYLFSPAAMLRLVQESEEVDLTDRLPQLRSPVLVVVGSADSEKRIASLDRYRALLPDATVRLLEGADHGLRVNGDRGPFYNLLSSFAARIDERERAK
jgi:pimeloyl-ACP methyl ester carboxylesterase